MRAMGAILGLGVAAGAALGQARHNVYIYDFDFSINPPGGPVEPAVINAGDIVVWIPLAEFHNTMACEGQDEYWESEILQLTETFEYQFTIPGVYWYYCHPHGWDNGDGTAGGMASTITVLPSPGALPLIPAALMALRRRR